MQKNDIAQRMHQEAGISKQEAAPLLDWILELLKTILQKGEPIAISSFGKFTVRSKAPRTGRNPRTGEEVIIPARRVVTFRASSHLKREINLLVQPDTVSPATTLSAKQLSTRYDCLPD